MTEVVYSSEYIFLIGLITAITIIALNKRRTFYESIHNKRLF